TPAKWGLLVAGELVKEGPSQAALEDHAMRHRIPLRRQENRTCPYITLPGTFDEYLNGLSSSTRYHIRRRTRDLEKKGARLDVYADPREILARLDTLFALHLARWRRDNQPGTFGRAGFAPFLREICAHPPEESGCRLFQIAHEEKPLAALLMFYFG